MKKRITVFVFLMLTISVLSIACDNSDKIICGNCASTIFDDSQYCSNCGVALFQSNSEISKDEPTEGCKVATTNEAYTDNTSSIVETEGSYSTEITSDSQTTPTSTHIHNYSDATCTAPKTCPCGTTSGSALGHNWSEATCTSPKKCSRCGTTSGSILDHSWSEATCTSPKKCSRCGTTSGSPLEHSYTTTIIPATCTSQGYTTYTCTCGDTYKDNYVESSHSYQNYICTSCGTIDEENTFQYLCQWLLNNGNTYAEYVYLESLSYNQTIKISYYPQQDNLALSYFTYDGDNSILTTIYLWSDSTSANYICGNDYCKIKGNIDILTYTSNFPLSYNTCSPGPYQTEYYFAEVTRERINVLLTECNMLLSINNVGISIEELGFKAY